MIIGIVGIRVVATNGVNVRGAGLWNCWFLRFLGKGLRFLFGRRQRCRQWEVNWTLRVELAKGIAGIARLFGYHRLGGSCGGSRCRRGWWSNNRVCSGSRWLLKTRFCVGISPIMIV